MAILAPSDHAITTAVAYLRAGDIVAFPTETVYGLGADAQNPLAIEKVFAAKDRPFSHPLIIHIATVDQLAEYATEITPDAAKLAQHFWPGPLTLVLYKQAKVLNVVTGEQNTVALRVPDHPVAQQLLRNFGTGIVAPSANRFGSLSPTLAMHVATNLGAKVPCIIDGGACPVGIESTIVDCTVTPVRILRLGAISSQQLSAVLAYPVTTNDQYRTNNASSQQQLVSQPRVPGSHTYHYASQTPLYLLSYWHLMIFLFKNLMQRKKTVVLTRHFLPFKNRYLTKITMPSSAADYAQCLYATLHEVDIAQFDIILVEQVPKQLAWLSIHDRLRKAAAKFSNYSGKLDNH